ncbi:ATP-binding protein [candidate division MSBL1 archaeon SCGC-AAA259A05]|uniref:ATP-binding protein n=1 Tax=candidate division MSBL1 archaeon SCGC-AAA259A05 TaxID=1698259 RepID=A0A133UBL0_9EURY|nr:ATP-binding protein [candidate division MSBL1 archaeon SCGC-AAA259A05]
MDPRPEIIKERLKDVDKLIPVASGKGGVGKSLIASTTALLISEKEYDVGLFDLDLQGPSAHVVLGAQDYNFPEEKKGIIPPTVGNIKFMSTVYYSRDEPSPLRGDDISNALRELLAVTRWGNLDYLIVDMPPGIGNETLDTIQLMKKAEFLVATTPSKMALSTVKKLVEMLKELKVPIAGIIENMKTENSPDIEGEIENLGVSYLGEIRFDRNRKEAIGRPRKILETSFADDLRKALPSEL